MPPTDHARALAYLDGRLLGLEARRRKLEAELAPGSALVTTDGFAQKAIESEDGRRLIVEGYAVRFEPDLEDEIVTLPGLAAAVEQYLADGGRVLHEHREADGQLGRVVDAEVRPEGVWVKIILERPPAGTKLRAVWEKVKAGAISGLSFRAKMQALKRAGQSTLIRLLKILEVSLCREPVNPHAGLLSVATKAFALEVDPLGSEARAILSTEAARRSHESVWDLLEAEAATIRRAAARHV
jgi:HK97 family phage prohead protease